MGTTRRRFMWISGAGIGGLMLARCADPDLTPDLTEFRPIPCPRTPIVELSALAAGEPFDFDYPEPGVECFVMKLGQGALSGVGPDADVVAYSYLCTHMGCSLRGYLDVPRAVLGPCPCHFSTFSLKHEGMVVLGQATQNLVRVSLEVEDDWLVATGLEGVIYGELAARCCEEEAG